ncbi:histidine phosphatase family protein [Hazenella coriacea]|uniref:Putative phosphoglycerate mutase n=1 Tax=Hazenella coriacea TaxID=1179467 RepID=A0A4R3L7U0_9BACL|nr:histidine phosphatase family protein [Hazenella coriacea]TCS95050.1 putative phosphoglycerate mutase [Hazenella coriacea]
MLTPITLIRHGETKWNKELRVQGHQNVPLSEHGIQQADRLGQYLKDQQKQSGYLYSSDLLRARQTAERIASRHQLQVQTSHHLRERYCGEWEGRTVEELKQVYPDFDDIRLNGGKYGVESIEQMKERMQKFVLEIIEKHPGEPIWIVSHGMSLSSLLTELTQGEVQIGNPRLFNTSFTHLIHHPEKGWQLHDLNQTPHLE